MDLSRYQLFFDALKTRAQKVNSMIFNGDYQHKFAPKHLNEAVYSYFEMGGKALRPGVLLFSCGAVGGEEEKALPAAAVWKHITPGLWCTTILLTATEFVAAGLPCISVSPMWPSRRWVVRRKTPCTMA